MRMGNYELKKKPTSSWGGGVCLPHRDGLQNSNQRGRSNTSVN